MRFCTSSARKALISIVAGLAIAVAFTTVGSKEAWAGDVIKDFSCTTDPFGVHVDVSGLGNTNLCVVGSATINLSCACAGGGGNCTSDAKKETTSDTVSASQSVEPKNGRVQTTFSLPINVGNGLCSGDPANLSCPSGQNAKLVKWDTPSNGATFTVCETTAPAGQPCSCAGTGLDQISCGPLGNITFAGKHDSCLNLF